MDQLLMLLLEAMGEVENQIESLVMAVLLRETDGLIVDYIGEIVVEKMILKAKVVFVAFLMKMLILLEVEMILISAGDSLIEKCCHQLVDNYFPTA